MDQDTVWLPRVGFALTPPMEGVADFTGIGGSFRVESVADLPWNGWQLCYGISGNIRTEYALNGYLFSSELYPLKDEYRISKAQMTNLKYPYFEYSPALSRFLESFGYYRDPTRIIDPLRWEASTDKFLKLLEDNLNYAHYVGHPAFDNLIRAGEDIQGFYKSLAFYESRGTPTLRKDMLLSMRNTLTNTLLESLPAIVEKNNRGGASSMIPSQGPDQYIEDPKQGVKPINIEKQEDTRYMKYCDGVTGNYHIPEARGFVGNLLYKNRKKMRGASQRLNQHRLLWPENLALMVPNVFRWAEILGLGQITACVTLFRFEDPQGIPLNQFRVEILLSFIYDNSTNNKVPVPLRLNFSRRLYTYKTTPAQRRAVFTGIEKHLNKRFVDYFWEGKGRGVPAARLVFEQVAVETIPAQEKQNSSDFIREKVTLELNNMRQTIKADLKKNTLSAQVELVDEIRASLQTIGYLSILPQVKDSKSYFQIVNSMDKVGLPTLEQVIDWILVDNLSAQQAEQRLSDIGQSFEDMLGDLVAPENLETKPSFNTSVDYTLDKLHYYYRFWRSQNEAPEEMEPRSMMDENKNHRHGLDSLSIAN